MYGVLLAVALSSAVAQATHPCDVQAPTVYRERSADLRILRIGWCFKPEDEDGVPITEPIGFALQINGGPDIDLGVVQPLVGVNAQGYWYYETQTPLLGPGVLTLKAYTATLGMSAASASITLTLRGRPKPPVNSTIIR